MVRESSTEPYTDEVAYAIERSARGVFTDALSAQRKVLAAFGVGVDGRDWLILPAADIIASAEQEFPLLRGRVPPPSARGDRRALIAWTLMHPRDFGVQSGRPGLQTGPWAAAAPIAEALHPDLGVLVAALILHCLAENTGLNLSTMLRAEPADLTATGVQHGILATSKARNHSDDRIAVSTGSIFTAGGLLQALTALTRFTRHYRATVLAAADKDAGLADKLYVEHRADATKSEIIGNVRLHHGWRRSAFDLHWTLTDQPRHEIGLRFRALRSMALHRAIRRDPDSDVHGHNARTRLHYLAHVLPVHVLAEQAAAAQDDMVKTALARFQRVEDASDGPAQTLAATPPDDRVDLLVSTCTNGGNDPDDTRAPCSLGLAACFTCPNGYRTAGHIPGLLATVAFAEIVRDNDPDEWENGEAALLHRYATDSLEQFPKTAVATIRDRTDLRAHIVTVSSLYTEMRR
jgi:hypothetical protein